MQKVTHIDSGIQFNVVLDELNGDGGTITLAEVDADVEEQIVGNAEFYMDFEVDS